VGRQQAEVSECGIHDFKETLIIALRLRRCLHRPSYSVLAGVSDDYTNHASRGVSGQQRLPRLNAVHMDRFGAGGAKQLDGNGDEAESEISFSDG
jgi:hypothetical protein